MNQYVIAGAAGLIWLIGAALTYSKAENEGRNGSLWGVFALIAGPIAWIAYALTRDQEPFAGSIGLSDDPEPSQALHVGYARESTRPDTDFGRRADPDYSDPYLERLIAKGDLRGAKEALHGLVQTAKETHDTALLASYEAYGQRIRREELKTVSRDAPAPIAGPPADFVDNTGVLLHQARADEGDDRHETLI